MNNRKNYNINYMDPISIYKEVLSGRLKQFPRNYWNDSDSLENSAIITRYFVENILNWPLERVKLEITSKKFVEYKLGGMISICFKRLPYNAIANAYPDKNIKPWEFKQVSDGFWNSDRNCREALEWLFFERLKVDKNDIINSINADAFILNDLHGLFICRFRGSVYNCLNFMYPDIFNKPWLIQNVPRGYWNNDDNVYYALNWLFNEELKWSREDVLKKLTVTTLLENKLFGLLTTRFHSNLINLISFIYPDVKPWELACITDGYWDNDENVKEALLWLFEDKINIYRDIGQVDHNIFKKYNLFSLLKIKFNCSPYKAVSFIYGNKFKPWELKQVPVRFWNDDKNVREALNWLIHDKLKWTIDEVKDNLTTKVFKENNLSGLLLIKFYNSPYSVIEYLYPGMFHVWDLKQVPKGYWNDEENIRDALEWFIHEKLSWNKEYAIKNLKFSTFTGSGLSGLVKHKFGKNPKRVLEFLYNLQLS